MKKALLCFSILFLAISEMHAQYLTKKEKGDLIDIVYNYFYKSPIAQRNANRNSGKSEQFILLLKVNSDCKIEEVSLLADNKNLDSGFAILSRLTASEFQSWKSITAKNKTILIPIAVINSANGNKEAIEFIDNFYKLGQTTEMLNIPGIDFKWPIKRKKEY